jgi:hypothetical protein
MSLRADEVNMLLNKIRGLFDEYARTLSPVWFNRSTFEERYRFAITKKMDIQAFLLAEISNFEKIRARFESRRKKPFSFSDKVDKIIEENNSRFAQYPQINFHPSAAPEVKHLYGAIAELGKYYIPVFRLIISEYSKRNSINLLETRFQRCALARGAKPAEAIDDHILVLSRTNVSEIDVDKSRTNYLKECSFLLYDLIKFCSTLLEERIPDLEQPVTFGNALYDPEIKNRIIENFSESTGYGAVLKIKDLSEQIISDFRLKAFKPSH